MSTKIRVGISHGDINGIGYEILIKTLMESRIIDFCTPIVYGSAKIAGYHRKNLNINNFSLNIIKDANEANPRRANVINCVNEDTRVELGKSTPEAGESSFVALEAATKDLKENKIDVLLTCPINKKNIQSEKFNFAGHTEYLQKEFDSPDAIMIMVSDVMKIALATGHISIAEVAECITEPLIIRKVKALNKSLIEDFAIRKPRIAVLGLNPHAGDEGFLGTEEQKIIIPALEKLRNDGIVAVGPFAADGFFGSGQFRKFDAILAMYHDQGLAVFKAISMDTGVNFTAGLPVVRTSPAHGTGYEIAGKNEASESSFRNALFLGCDIFRNRNMHRDLTANPLKSYDLDKMN